MNFEQLVPIVQKRLSESRFEHVMGVVEEATRLGKLLGEDEKKLKIAALLHDIAKCEHTENLKYILINFLSMSELLQYDVELWHAPVGSFQAEQQLKITDQAILTAIRYHTTGRAAMTIFEKIIFLADYTEYGRQGKHVEKCREILATGAVDEAMIHIYKETIIYLLAKGKKIHLDTITGYNYLMDQTGNRVIGIR